MEKIHKMLEQREAKISVCSKFFQFFWNYFEWVSLIQSIDRNIFPPVLSIFQSFQRSASPFTLLNRLSIESHGFFSILDDNGMRDNRTKCWHSNRQRKRGRRRSLITASTIINKKRYTYIAPHLYHQHQHHYQVIDLIGYNKNDDETDIWSVYFCAPWTISSHKNGLFLAPQGGCVAKNGAIRSSQETVVLV